ncbi:hypothetical protein KP509_25G014600 [Ceratopteris richardii]|uniref:Exostosin GT47 domain-containing protein n=1 Tax=Ceratopteris richardii TaxID=49495 RepID=A0A8T2RQJ1_CERRI|nr:hypothetical protein KP509_25G014600 [Ceratopteris richardii]
MPGLGRLPKYVSDANETVAPPSNGLRRLWSAQRASPPPRFLLVVLLSAQIVFLAIFRLGPSASMWKGQGTENSLQTPLAATSDPSATKPSPEEGEDSSFAQEMEMPTEDRDVLEMKEMDNVADSDQFKGPNESGGNGPNQEQSAPVTEEHLDEALPSVGEDFLAETPSKESKTSEFNEAVQEEEKTPSFELSDESKPSVDDNWTGNTAAEEAVPVDAEADASADNRVDLLLDSSALVAADTASKLGDCSTGSDASTCITASQSPKKTSNRRKGRRKRNRKSTGKSKKIVSETKKGGEPNLPGGSDTAVPAAEESLKYTSEDEISSKNVEESNMGASVKQQSETEQQEFQYSRELEKDATFSNEETDQNGVQIKQVIPEAEFQIEQNHQEDKISPSVEYKSHEDSSDVAIDATSVSEEHEGQPTTEQVREISSEEAWGASTPVTEVKDHAEDGQNLMEGGSRQDTAREEEAVMKPLAHQETASSECMYGYIYLYNLPDIFNRGIHANCSTLHPWTDVCPTLENGGLGQSLGESSPLGQVGSWYASNPFMAEMVFHNRMLQHNCLTDNPDAASAFYLPFYAGLGLGRHLYAGSSIESRDGLSNHFVGWLMDQPAWKRSSGSDHFLMIGRNTWDFRRSQDEGWGSGFLNKPEMQNVTKLLLERNPWDGKEMAVPCLTNFHPQNDADLAAWQDHIRGLQRNRLFSFAAMPKDRFPDDFRRILFKQCEQSGQCQSLDCSNGICNDNQKTLGLFMDSVFCLQPRGDSFTRRSIFDCLLAGTIPVFFWHRSAYKQFEWHLPADHDSYSVFISRYDVRNGTKVEDVLNAIAPEKVQSMREAVIQLLPKMVYAVSGLSLKQKDAFDVAIEGVMRSFKGSMVSLQR